jgi:hypothetical protein
MVLELGWGHYYALMNFGGFRGLFSQFLEPDSYLNRVRPAVLSARPSFINEMNDIARQAYSLRNPPENPRDILRYIATFPPLASQYRRSRCFQLIS